MSFNADRRRTWSEDLNSASRRGPETLCGSVADFLQGMDGEVSEQLVEQCLSQSEMSWLSSALAVADVTSLSQEIEASFASGLERDRAELRDVFASLDRIGEKVVPELEQDLGCIQSLMDSLEVRVSQFQKQRSWLNWPMGKEKSLDDHARYSYQLAHAQLRTEESLLRRMEGPRGPFLRTGIVDGGDGGGTVWGGGGSGVKATSNMSNASDTSNASTTGTIVSTAADINTSSTAASSSASTSPYIMDEGAGAIVGTGVGPGEEVCGADVDADCVGVDMFVGTSEGGGAGRVLGESELRAVAADTFSKDVVQL
ncbi:hypothetical protein B484DRAFT_458800 [Ochromonadaceae sp. CCMP2298]|nr:hypothetical protein B484DRAFT_458800 [Ochromonadaceae sp. CCMP2298]